MTATSSARAAFALRRSTQARSAAAGSPARSISASVMRVGRAGSESTSAARRGSASSVDSSPPATTIRSRITVASSG
jgi:hypothetical protein